MPRDNGAITLLTLAAALAVGVLGVSERVHSQHTLYPSSHAPSHTVSLVAVLPLYYADWRESQE